MGDVKKKNPKVVVAAVIERNGSILIARRKRGKMHPGKWEFPGGTLEEGESPEHCLKRELLEELGITAEVGDLICVSEHTYEPGWTIRLITYAVKVVHWSFRLNDHEEIRWVKPADLPGYEYSEADLLVVDELARRYPEYRQD